MKDTTGPAFPQHYKDEQGVYAEEGMTYRQWLIGMALKGLCSNPTLTTVKLIDQLAIEHADNIIAMLKAEGK